MSVLSTEEASAIASVFLVEYYTKFVQPGHLGDQLSELYSDKSHVALANLEQTVPLVAAGKPSITAHYNNLGNMIPNRKVQIVNADALPGPNGTIQIVCQGVLYIPSTRRVFLHIFTLAPTPYRDSVYHISIDYLRFVHVEHEVIPEGAIVVSQSEMTKQLEQAIQQEIQNQRQQQEQQQQQQAAAAAVAHRPQQERPQHQHQHQEPREHWERPPREHKEDRPPRGDRPPKFNREERKPRGPADKGSSASGPREHKERPERGDRPERPERPNRGPVYIRLCDVPEEIKLSEIREHATKAGTEVQDAYWFGKNSTHCVMVLAPSRAAFQLLKSGNFSVKGKQVKAVSFSP